MTYRPELDGLRAIAVLAVIAFHYGLGMNGPGGVTVFFALSGFLITSLLLGEHWRDGRIALGEFYRRRARRLLPAATVAVLATLVWAAAAGEGAGLARQAFAALTYWANWERYGSSVGYGESAFAPFTHYWSLAIEEQFYVVLPALAAVCLSKGRKLFGGVLVALFAGSALYAALVASNPMSYYDTGARVCELLAGSLLALRPIRRGPVVGYLSLIGVVWALLTSAPALVVSGLTLGVIIGAPKILALRPLVAIGRVSYGLYLFHPLALYATGDRLSALALMTGVTLMSYHLIENPIRRRLSWARARLAIGALTAAALVTACAGPYEQRTSFVLTPTEPAPVVVTTAPPSTIGSIDGPAVAEGTAERIAPLRISLAGDSTGTALGVAFHAWAEQDPSAEWVFAPEPQREWTGAPWYPGWGLERPGCGLLHDFHFRWRASDPTGVPEGHNRTGDRPDHHDGCDWRNWIPQALAQMDLDVLVVSFGPSSVWEHRINGEWMRAGMPEHDRILADRIDEFEREAAKHGTTVVWVGYPYISTFDGVVPPGDTSYLAMDDPAVTDAVHRILQARPCYVDLRPAFNQNPDLSWWYEDGADHLSPHGAAQAVAEIVPALDRCGR